MVPASTARSRLRLFQTLHASTARARVRCCEPLVQITVCGTGHRLRGLSLQHEDVEVVAQRSLADASSCPSARRSRGAEIAVALWASAKETEIARPVGPPRRRAIRAGASSAGARPSTRPRRRCARATLPTALAQPGLLRATRARPPAPRCSGKGAGRRKSKQPHHLQRERHEAAYPRLPSAAAFPEEMVHVVRVEPRGAREEQRHARPAAEGARRADRAFASMERRRADRGRPPPPRTAQGRARSQPGSRRGARGQGGAPRASGGAHGLARSAAPPPPLRRPRGVDALAHQGGADGEEVLRRPAATRCSSSSARRSSRSRTSRAARPSAPGRRVFSAGRRSRSCPWPPSAPEPRGPEKEAVGAAAPAAGDRRNRKRGLRHGAARGGVAEAASGPPARRTAPRLARRRKPRARGILDVTASL